MENNITVQNALSVISNHYEVTIDEIMRILNTAQHAGVSQDKLKEYAMSAGLSEDDVNSALGN